MDQKILATHQKSWLLKTQVYYHLLFQMKMAFVLPNFVIVL